MANILGTSGDDELAGTPTGDQIYGYAGEGDDTVNAVFTNPSDPRFAITIDSTTLLTGDSDAVTAYGEEGADLLYGSGGNDFLDGGLGNDWLFGGAAWISSLVGMTNTYLYGFPSAAPSYYTDADSIERDLGKASGCCASSGIV